MAKTKVGVVFGGKSSEYPVSLHSAASFLANMPEKYESVLIGIDPEGRFYLSEASIDEIEHDNWKAKSRPGVFVEGGFYVFDEGKKDLDVVFPVLHGKNGEDGSLQGLFELYGIPYVGCDVASSANCMDKEVMHRLCKEAGVVCADYVLITPEDEIDAQALAKEMPLPWVVKPARAGSSFGVSFVDDLDQLDEAVKEALHYDGKGKALIEKAVPGFEIGCSVLGDKDLFVGEVDEIETAHPVFDYEGKYEFADSAIYCPARIPQEKRDEARTLAKEVFKLMGCSGLARVDFFLSPDGQIVLNEVNTLPGFTAHSRYPSMMKEAGLPFEEVIDRLIQSGLQRKVGAC